jgi:streptomycin 6-kinase
VTDDFVPMMDLTEAKRVAEELAVRWNLNLGAPYAYSNVSYVAAVGDDLVLKVPWGGDDESLHEGDALELWNGNGAVRVRRRFGVALLEERAVPGTDLSEVDEGKAVATAIEIAHVLWRPACAPFRPVAPEVVRWLDEADEQGSPLVSLARALFEAMKGGGADWLAHGDLHHHNILRAGSRYLAIDPKPYLSDREYDVASFLWNPMNNRLADAEQTERRIERFAASGLDEYKIRAWTIIRGAYLRPGPEYVEPLRALLA